MTIAIVAFVVASLIVAVYLFLWKNGLTEAIEELTLWLIFTAGLALTPIIFNAALIFISGSNPVIFQLLSRGELLLISVAIGADAVGEVIGSGRQRRLIKIMAAGSCIFLLIMSSLLFAVASSDTVGQFDDWRVSTSSIFIFLMMILSAGSCVLLGEVK